LHLICSALPKIDSDTPYVLDRLLENQTSLEPKQLMTDTAGYSDIVFGLFWLLGFQFSPRLADIGESRFWRLARPSIVLADMRSEHPITP
jgi:TnpA family transposase